MTSTMRQGSGVEEGSGVSQGSSVDEGSGSDYAVGDDSGAAAYVNAGLVGHCGGRDGVREHWGGHGVRDDGGYCVRHHGGAGHYIHTGLVGDGGGGDGERRAVCPVAEGALLEEVSESSEAVSGESVGGVAQQRSGKAVTDDGRAGAYVHTGLVRYSGGGGDHSRGDDGGMSDGGGYNSGVHEGSDGGVAEGLQGFSLEVNGTSVDDLSGVQGAAVRVQHESRMVRGLRQGDD